MVGGLKIVRVKAKNVPRFERLIKIAIEYFDGVVD